MNIAIPTNDRKSIAKRTGKASEIAFYTINNGTIISVTYTKNTHSHDDHRRSEEDYDENEEHNYDKLLDILINVDLFLVKSVGKFMKKTLQKGNINYQLVKIDDISEILKDYL